MQPENLAYALAQVVHNFGAATLVGGSVFWLWPLPRQEYARSFAWILLFAWGAQIASGILFGLTSLYYYGETPDLSAVAMAALVIKVCSAAAGLLLIAWYLARGKDWGWGQVKRLFQGQAALAVLALTAAAFLRWFS
jgi:hypothetical protein